MSSGYSALGPEWQPLNMQWINALWFYSRRTVFETAYNRLRSSLLTPTQLHFYAVVPNDSGVDVDSVKDLMELELDGPVTVSPDDIENTVLVGGVRNIGGMRTGTRSTTKFIDDVLFSYYVQGFIVVKMRTIEGVATPSVPLPGTYEVYMHRYENWAPRFKVKLRDKMGHMRLDPRCHVIAFENPSIDGVIPSRLATVVNDIHMHMYMQKCLKIGLTNIVLPIERAVANQRALEGNPMAVQQRVLNPEEQELQNIQIGLDMERQSRINNVIVDHYNKEHTRQQQDVPVVVDPLMTDEVTSMRVNTVIAPSVAPINTDIVSGAAVTIPSNFVEMRRRTEASVWEALDLPYELFNTGSSTQHKADLVTQRVVFQETMRQIYRQTEQLLLPVMRVIDPHFFDDIMEQTSCEVIIRFINKEIVSTPELIEYARLGAIRPEALSALIQRQTMLPSSCMQVPEQSVLLGMMQPADDSSGAGGSSAGGSGAGGSGAGSGSAGGSGAGGSGAGSGSSGSAPRNPGNK